MNNDQKILLVGDIGKAFLDKAFVANPDCDICAEIPQAIEAVKNNSYSVIAIVMSRLQAKLNLAIKTLRDNISTSRETRIVLLAQMYEEPIAIRFANISYKDEPLVDDYMICPITSYHELLVKYPGEIHKPVSESPAEATAQETQVKYTIQDTQNEEVSARIRHLEKLATEDDLTGLKNRRYIMEFTRQIIEYAEKENGRVTLLMFDIDDFKKYNDLYGHSAGDEILKQAAKLMLRCCRSHDVIGRIGGDEFAVVFWDDPSILKAVIEQSKVNDRRSIDSDHPHEAMLIAQRFISELENFRGPSLVARSSENRDTRVEIQVPDLGPQGTGTLTISGGLASYPRDGKNVQELFEQADKALLEAKRGGKNRIYLVGKP